MAELDERDLQQAFDDLLRQTVPRVHPVGAEAARATARRRRNQRVVLAAFVAVIAVVVPLFVFVIPNRDGAMPVPPATPTSNAPSPTGSPPPPSPSPEPSAAVTYTNAVTGPFDLAEATLPLDWSAAVFGTDYGCTSGAIRFFAGRHIENAQVHQDIMAVGHSDVDGDGNPDSLALVKCWNGIFGLSQLIAVTKEGSTYRGLGVVVRSGMGFPGIGEISRFGVAATGEIRARVHNITICCDQTLDETAGQWRVFRLAGTTFTQIDGPQTFQANAALADIRVEPKPVTLGRKDANGIRHGTITVTVVNRGPADATGVRIVLPRNGITVGKGGDASRCVGRVCRIGDLDSGQSVTLSIPFSLPYDVPDGETMFGMIGLFIDDYTYGYIDIPLA